MFDEVVSHRFQGVEGKWISCGAFRFGGLFRHLVGFLVTRDVMWPGIHTIEISVPGRRVLRESMLSSTAEMTDCPDWCEGEVEAFIAGWLSA